MTVYQSNLASVDLLHTNLDARKNFKRDKENTAPLWVPQLTVKLYI